MTEALSHPAEAALPTLNKLGVTLPVNVDPESIASRWLSSFAQHAVEGNVEGILGGMITSDFSSTILCPASELSADGVPPQPQSSDVSVYWKDILALTWDFRTFEGTEKIRAFLEARLKAAEIKNVKPADDVKPKLVQPFPDVAWVEALFSFETKVGYASGIVRLVPVPSGNDVVWKAHTIFTNLEDLQGFPEKAGPLRNAEPNHGKWIEEREREKRFEDKDPTVLIIGGGQSGLTVAARLKALGVSNLIVDKNERVGDNWRTRYEALCLHDPVWYDHMPYIPFPSTWPVFTPAKKLANWLEFYAEAMELNVWTSSTVKSAIQDQKTKVWSVTVLQANGQERVFKVKHVIFATGFGGNEPYVPTIPGMDKFKGQTLHSLQHHKATDHAGKKVVVIGACTSAHDICVDYVDHGVDVTMIQRSSTHVLTTKKGVLTLLGGLYSEASPPTDLADRLNLSYPNFVNAGMTFRATKYIAALDKDILDGLKARGFKTNNGYRDTGLLLLVWDNGGGYYLDVGGSQYVIDGKIKLKSDGQIKEFTETGLRFEDGSELEADVVVFCTGFGNVRDGIIRICGEEVGQKCKQIWGLNEEGEILGCWREIGFPGLWNMMGNLALCRVHSKHVALQIKAIEEGLFSERYSAP